MSESKPSDDASLLPQNAVKTGDDHWLQDESGRYLFTAPDGSRCKGGMNSVQALVWNVRTSFWMAREMTNGKHHEKEYRCQNEGRSCPQ
jgi:hypothetical protein